MVKVKALVDMFFQGQKYQADDFIEMDDRQAHIHVTVKMVERVVEPKPQPKIEVKA